MLAWMLYATAVGAIVAGASFALEGLAAIWGLPRRAVWVAGIAIAAVVPPALAFRRAPARRVAASGVQRVSIPFGATAAGGPAAANAPMPLRRERLTIDPAWDRGAMLVWVGASIILLGVLARTFIVVRRHRRSWRESEVDGHRVLIAGDAGPAVVGAINPRIVLPAWALTLADEERRMMLRHEAEHVRAGDPVLLLASAIVVALLPWNPALWLLVRRLRLAIEIDCDRRVLQAVDAPREYGMLLLAVGARHGTSLPLAASLAERQPLLERRIVAMTSLRPERPLIASLPLAAVLAAAGVVAAQTPTPPPLATARLASAPAVIAGARAMPTPERNTSASAGSTSVTAKGDTVRTAPAVLTDSVIEVRWENAPIDNVLDAFAGFSGRRITHTARVSGTVTATASGERWNDALARIMRDRGYVVDFSVDPIVVDAARTEQTKENLPLDTIAAWIARYHPEVIRGNGHPNRVTIVIGLDESYLASSAEDANTASPQRLALDRKDIESVEVLKGAAAVEQFGAAAEHGIVLIRTKAADSTVYDDQRLQDLAITLRSLSGKLGQEKINRGPSDPLFIVDGVVVPSSEVARAGLVSPAGGGVANMHIVPTRILQVDVLKLTAGQIGPDATSVIVIQLKDNGR